MSARSRSARTPARTPTRRCITRPRRDRQARSTLAPYLGRCRVIHAIGVRPLVRWEHIAHAAHRLPPRVLVRTYARVPVDRWDAGLAAYAPETIERLADAGVLLVGIDSASIDPADSKPLPSHQVIRRRGLRVLENLVLDDVPEGDYELIALPLKLITADASPGARGAARTAEPMTTRDETALALDAARPAGAAARRSSTCRQADLPRRQLARRAAAAPPRARAAGGARRNGAQGLIRSWNSAGWMTLPQRVGDKIAPLVGAGPGELVVADSTSVNLFKVLSAALSMHAGDAPGADRHRLANAATSRPTSTSPRRWRASAAASSCWSSADEIAAPRWTRRLRRADADARELPHRPHARHGGAHARRARRRRAGGVGPGAFGRRGAGGPARPTAPTSPSAAATST